MSLLKNLIEIGKSVVIAFLAAAIIITFVFETVSIDGRSMEPTLKDRDKLIIEKLSLQFTKPKSGDIVVIKNPTDTRERLIKRVVAVGGDRVMINNNKLYINGAAKDEPYIKNNSIKGYYSEVIVPENTIFVLGDNRNNSRDSRFPDVGFVNIKLIDGRAALRIYPFNNIGRIR